MARRGALFVSVIAVLLAACSSSGNGGSAATVAAPTTTSGSSGASTSSSPATSGGQPKDACVLLTAADAQTALGGPVGAPDAHTGGGNNCLYSTANGSNTIELSVTQPSTFDTGKQLSGAGLRVSTISGVGDDAYLSDKGVAGLTLSVLSGGASFDLTIFNKNESATQITAAEEIAAKAAVSRL